jgi:hypothetical protein
VQANTALTTNSVLRAGAVATAPTIRQAIAKPFHTHSKQRGETAMKIKTNVRAGSQNQKRGTSTDSSSIDNTVVTYVSPVSRCVGI